VTKCLFVFFPLFPFFCVSVCHSSGPGNTVYVESGEGAAVESPGRPTEFLYGEGSGKQIASEGKEDSSANSSGYPKTFIIPKGVCETGSPVLTIEE
jgi:hypothetical protein